MSKSKAIFAFAAVDSRGRLNPYWVRPTAKAVRQGRPGSLSWSEIRKDGWRIVKVKITAAGRPR